MVDRTAFQAAARHALDDARPRIEAGESKTLFRAIHLCGAARLPMPDWLAVAFAHRLAKVEHFKTRSWDEAFGPPEMPAGHLDSLRTAELRNSVYDVIQACHFDDPARAINDFYEEVGARFGIGRTTTQKLYLRAKQERGPILMRTVAKK